MAAVGIIWSILLDTNIGFIPYVLEQIGIHNVHFPKCEDSHADCNCHDGLENFGYTMSILVVGNRDFPELL